jgi:LCP family protein required for cell wall assembly
VFEKLSTPSLRGLRNRILIGLCIGMGVVVVGFGAAIVYGAAQLGHIPRIACSSCDERTEGKAMNVLVVGSDSRQPVAAEADEFGTPDAVTGQRSDTMMVLRIEPNREHAAVLSIPRDLWVPIASGGVNRINTAFERGPDNLVRTIRGALGIPIHHYIEVDFAGFRDIVRAVGGVAVYFAAPARDTVTGLDVKRSGCTELDGDQALAYVRSRNYETLVGGRWQAGGAGDLDRISRQQDFIRRVLAKVRSVRNPVTIHRLVTTGTSNVRLDKELGARDIEKLALQFRTLVPNDVAMQTVPAVFDHELINGRRASILRVQQPQTRDLVDRFLGRARPAPLPSVTSTPVTRPPAGLVTTTTPPARTC